MSSHLDSNKLPASRQRELPGATGVIDLAQFIAALRRLGYDGPVRAEPFEFTGFRQPCDTTCAAGIVALRRVLL